MSSLFSDNMIQIALALPMGIAVTMAFQQALSGSTLYNKVTGVGKYASIAYVLGRFALLAGSGFEQTGYPMLWFPVVLTLGPFIFFYYNGLLFDPRAQWQRMALHLTPASLMLVAEIVVLPFFKIELDNYFTAHLKIPLQGPLLLGGALLFIHLACYSAAMVYYQWRLWQEKSLRSILKFLLGGNAVGLLTYIVIFTGFVVGLPELWALGGSLVVVSFTGMLILDNREPTFFAALGQAHRRTEYARAALAGLATEQMVDRLQALMEVDKLYRKMELSLNDVAEELTLKPKQLSGLLNSHLKMNFFQYVNGYRVTEAKQVLRQAPERNILAVCYDVGFNSKAVFYRAFKQATGVTPSEYRKKAS